VSDKITISYIKVAPSIFEVGDLVEATISFIVLPIKDERYIIIPQLQVLTLLQKVSCIYYNNSSNLIICRSPVNDRATFWPAKALVDWSVRSSIRL
jgi:hypothetical protein